MLNYLFYLMLILNGNDDLVQYIRYENIDYRNDILMKILDEEKQRSKELECIKPFIPENSGRVEIYKYIVGANALEKEGNTFGPDDTKKMSEAYSSHSDVYRVWGKIFAVTSKYQIVCKVSLPESAQILSEEVKEHTCKVCDGKHKLYIMKTSENIFITTENIGMDKIEEIINQNGYDNDRSPILGPRSML